jgi:transketolase
MTSQAASVNRRGAFRAPGATGEYLRRQGLLKLLAIKDSDVRLLCLEQCRDAVDKSLHAGGAFSATIPLVALHYGGFMHVDLAEPTRRGQDLFVLSKGHAVAALAAIYADLGYFDASVLKNSRSYSSILNGHPGPILPGVQVATGPMGQGLGVAQGFALAGKMSPRFDAYCLTGDGELQEGPIWEAVMYAGQKHLDNLCVMVDRNNGQLDMANRMVFPMPELERVFASFEWHVHRVDATQYDGVYAALEAFRYGPRNGKPTAIICHGMKGHGALSDLLNRHKVTVPDAVIDQELALQGAQRRDRVDEFNEFYRSLENLADGSALQDALRESAGRMHLDVARGPAGALSLTSMTGPVVTVRAPARRKRVEYDAAQLPRLDRSRQYAASDIVTAAMKVFATDAAVVSIDADLATTSGLEAGVAAVDQRRALNVGVAEANMMLIGEAFAALGHQTWVSTFCPFFDWKVMRRIAVGHQERLESAAARDGWLSDGHGLDLTMLATAANFETRTNGATHMGNDDCTIFDGLGHVKIIDVSCPQQMLSLMRWIMEGNRGLLYVRVMRTPSPVLYDGDYAFDFGKGYVLKQSTRDAVIVSSGRGVHEALAAAALADERGLSVGVVDMPSIDDSLLLDLVESGTVVCLAEQNNGFILQNLLKLLFRRQRGLEHMSNVMAINTLDANGKPQFIHSGNYDELIDAFGLTPSAIAAAIAARVRAKQAVGSAGPQER